MAKLLMISGDRSLASGARGAFYNTLEELHEHFERIDIICPKVKSEKLKVQSFFSNVFVHPSPWPLFMQWLWIVYKGRQLAHTLRPAIMTVHEYPLVFNGVGVWVLHRLTGIPYMLEVHHIVGYPRAAGLCEKIGRLLTRLIVPWTARQAAVVRVVNKTQVPDFLQAAGVPEQKIIHVPSAYVDLDIFRPQEVAKEYDMIFVGRLVRNKGLDLFLDVVRLSGATALVVGDGPLLESAKLRVKKEKLLVSFHGYAKDATEIADLINQSRLLLMTSLNEGGPRVVVEALACGVPVVATPVGIVPDVLPPEAIEEWDSAALADKVKNILGDPALYQRLREGGLTAAERFERRAAIQNYAEQIKRLI